MRITRAKIRLWLRNLLDVPDTPHVVEHFEEHGEMIDGLRRDLSNVTHLLSEAVRQLNATTINCRDLSQRLTYYEQHSALLGNLRDELIRAEKKKQREARENGTGPIVVVQ